MSPRNSRPIRPALAGLELVALLAVLTLAGCQDLFNAVFNTAAPTGVSASDGEYPNEINVSWGAPNLSGEQWKNVTVKEYCVSWDEPISGASGAHYTSGTSYSIPVPDANRALEYAVTVQTILSSGSGGSSNDTGFALYTEPLLWHDGGGEYATAGVDHWYLTMMQQGFSYTFAFSGSGSVSVYPYQSLERIVALTPGTSPAWTCDSDGNGHKFFIRVQPDFAGGSFRASYSF